MKKLVCFFVFIIISSCTLIPSKEWFKSDTLDSNLKFEELDGRYSPTKEAIEKLKNHFNKEQLDSLQKSYILISTKDSIIVGKNLPLNLDYHGQYKVSSGKRKIYVFRNDHEKYRFIPRPDDKQPKMHFRIRNGEKSILINLNLDPDGWDYYEYILQKN